MPRKLRELKEELRKAGCVWHSGKGSHTVWSHPRLAEVVVLSGNDGDDAKPYQERAVRRLLKKWEESK